MDFCSRSWSQGDLGYEIKVLIFIDVILLKAEGKNKHSLFT